MSLDEDLPGNESLRSSPTPRLGIASGHHVVWGEEEVQPSGGHRERAVNGFVCSAPRPIS